MEGASEGVTFETVMITIQSAVDIRYGFCSSVPRGHPLKLAIFSYSLSLRLSIYNRFIYFLQKKQLDNH